MKRFALLILLATTAFSQQTNDADYTRQIKQFTTGPQFITETRRYPFTRALSVGTFPDNIEQLGLAARESIREFKPYFILIFVDVIEFEGTHIRKFYGELGKRYGAFVGEEALGAMRQRLRPSVSAIDALLITARVFFNYFTIEILFNVPEPFGKDAAHVIKELSDIVRNGILMNDQH